MTEHVVINVGMGRCGRLAGSKARSRSILVLQASPFVYERARHILVIIKIHEYICLVHFIRVFQVRSHKSRAVNYNHH